MERFLIAHKAAGELAYDIAHKLELDGEEVWILSTGGWRVFPFWNIPLRDIAGNLAAIEALMDDDAKDCFVPSIKVEDRAAAQNLIESLGLIKREPVRRI